LDWKGLSAAEVKTNILENLQQGSIILQHSAGGPGEDLSGTVKALDDIIRVLKKDGYKFVTVDELLDISYKR
jgi:peptidoglycan/xylan/chitin deacetylase (PgdA/CDA1 family)